MKICNTCNQELPLSSFQVRTDTGKLRNDCRSCRSASNLKRYHEREETRVANRRASHVHNVKRYGLSIEDYDLMFEKQSGCCKICKCEVFKPTDNLGVMVTACIDHCHDTGFVRGLLCRKCNTGIGSFKESLDNLKEAVKYLEESLENRNL